MPTTGRELALEPLEPARFAAFGSVIAFDDARARPVNDGTARRADTRALFDHIEGTLPVLAVYRLEAQAAPVSLTVFERHPLSSQSFVSLSVSRFLVVVAPSGPDGLPDAGAARAFVGANGTGLSYRRDQWHTPVMALGDGGDLLMIMAERGSPADCVEHRLARPLTLRSPEGTLHGA